MFHFLDATTAWIGNRGREMHVDVLRIVFSHGRQKQHRAGKTPSRYSHRNSTKIDDTRMIIWFEIRKCFTLKITQHTHDIANFWNLFHFLAGQTAWLGDFGCYPHVEALRTDFWYASQPQCQTGKTPSRHSRHNLEKNWRHKNDFLIPDSKMLHTDDSINTRYYNFLEFLTFSWRIHLMIEILWMRTASGWFENRFLIREITPISHWKDT